MRFLYVSVDFHTDLPIDTYRIQHGAYPTFTDLGITDTFTKRVEGGYLGLSCEKTDNDNILKVSVDLKKQDLGGITLWLQHSFEDCVKQCSRLPEDSKSQVTLIISSSFD